MEEQIKYIRENVIKFIELNFNTSLIMYGPIGSGKTTLMNAMLKLLVQELLTVFESQALFFLEAFEMFFDLKTSTEKKQNLIRVPHTTEGKPLFKT